jgi:hypothetical protein
MDEVFRGHALGDQSSKLKRRRVLFQQELVPLLQHFINLRLLTACFVVLRIAEEHATCIGETTVF